MKVCPICAAKAFDDAEVCFGCLHRFEVGRAEPRGAGVSLTPDASDVSCTTAERQTLAPIAHSVDSDQSLRSGATAPRPSAPASSSTPPALQPDGVSHALPGLMPARPTTGFAAAEDEAEAPGASTGAVVRAIGNSVRAEPTGIQGWTVTFELPGIGVDAQDTPSAVADIEAAGKADEDARDGRGGLPHSACSVVVHVAASSFAGKSRHGYGTSASERTTVRRGDGRGTHARDRRSGGLVMSKTNNEGV